MRSSTLTAIAFSILVGLPTHSVAGSEDVVIEDAWSRASIGINRPGAAYMTLRNKGSDPVTLVGLETPLAMMPDIHETKTDANGVSSMAPTGAITIPPGASVSLEPGGLHVMLMRLQTKMVEGATFPLTLNFSDGGILTVNVPIHGIAARGPEG
ncbi:copper chaperone PCu(A)C [Cohaesibacter sp. CAU 1516]|uniref:copper chaperone PCu(A)C n=1 Tax=Cohaesibacter sp. CAU 1516 TaxID=2576038 RepID=UPI0010FF41BA|nr:copper chaperone PCu(A)C [Cohaesibacter sp. CAU 1516]TLP45410.1 copper chaperone PCu(A)C [Cohaesibacter sp. CAU 1516]